MKAGDHDSAKPAVSSHGLTVEERARRIRERLGLNGVTPGPSVRVFVPRTMDIGKARPDSASSP